MAPLKVGVMVDTVQSSDIMGADILGNCSVTVAKEMVADGRKSFVSVAKDMEFYWIAETLAKPATMTPTMKIVPNVTYETAPRDFWVLLIGGPSARHRPASADTFMKEAYAKSQHVFTTCTGSMWLASTGLLNGKKATTNRQFLGLAEQDYPEVEWLDQRWVVDQDRKLWTSGGAMAGIDMVAAFVKENFNKELAEQSLGALDVNEEFRGQYYKQGDCPGDWGLPTFSKPSTM